MGFALALDRLANANTSVFVSEVSCSLSSHSSPINSVTILFKPSEILTHEWELFFFTESILISTACLQVSGYDIQHGSNFGVPSNPTFLVCRFFISWKMYSRHDTVSAKCKNSSVCFVTKYCPTSTVFRNPASIQILINWSGCGSFSKRSLCFCNRFSYSGISIEDVGVIINKSAGAKSGSDCSVSTSLPVLVWQTLYSSHTSETAP